MLVESTVSLSELATGLTHYDIYSLKGLIFHAYIATQPDSKLLRAKTLSLASLWLFSQCSV